MTAPIRVLFIEDNPGDARLVREELRSADSQTIIRLEWVNRLDQGLERIASNQTDAVLLDLNLPDSEGLDTLTRVISFAPGMPVIIMTGQADEAMALQAVQAGAQDYLVKGQVDGRLLIRSIQYAIQRKQVEEALHAKNLEIKMMTQQLWQAARLATMGELAASIAHELNNPLATVSLRTEMLLAQVPPDDPKTRPLQIIESEVKRMSTLVENLLQFSRRATPQITTVNVREEVENTLELIQYHLRKYSILTRQEISPEIPLVQVDRQQLRQVLLNLFTNAADAMPQGGTLTVRIFPGEKPALGLTAPLPVSNLPQVVIEVSDTGQGISPETLEQVWEPFYTTKPEGKGTGLGLAICRRIVQEHDGTIEIISKGVPGKGTTIRITLPAVRTR